uniref:Uncharacterized protein n=1 Tax=Trametes gibbosa TaxID=160864 RepID=A0A6G6FQM1_9APHY|nr:hypothetical protein [Trametes gibbosa]QIE48578.1 hypothetical protein [Trametes gibbosa]
MQWVKVMRLARAHNPDPSQEVSLPQCPICRTELNEQRPMIPNIRMDNAVQTHISLSAQFGRVDWEPTGKRYLDFVKRKEYAHAVEHPSLVPLTCTLFLATDRDAASKDRSTAGHSASCPKPPTNHALDWVDEMYSEVENLSSEE